MGNLKSGNGKRGTGKIRMKRDKFERLKNWELENAGRKNMTSVEGLNERNRKKQPLQSVVSLVS